LPNIANTLRKQGIDPCQLCPACQAIRTQYGGEVENTIEYDIETIDNE